MKIVETEWRTMQPERNLVPPLPMLCKQLKELFSDSGLKRGGLSSLKTNNRAIF